MAYFFNGIVVIMALLREEYFSQFVFSLHCVRNIRGDSAGCIFVRLSAGSDRLCFGRDLVMTAVLYCCRVLTAGTPLLTANLWGTPCRNNQRPLEPALYISKMGGTLLFCKP